MGCAFVPHGMLTMVGTKKGIWVYAQVGVSEEVRCAMDRALTNLL